MGLTDIWRVQVIAALISTPVWFTGCASPETATVRSAEKIIAQYGTKQPARPNRSGKPGAESPAQGPAWATPVAAGPGRIGADPSRKHLLELYQGQQEIIERLEAKQNAGLNLAEDIGRGDSNEEGHAADLPEDISAEDLLRILGKQQKLLKVLTAREARDR